MFQNLHRITYVATQVITLYFSRWRRWSSRARRFSGAGFCTNNSKATGMSLVFKLRNLIAAGLLLAVAAYYLYVPLPDGITERHKMHFMSAFFRLFHYYPTRAMGYVGNSWLVLYARVSLNYLSYLLALLSMFDGGILEYHDVKFSNVPVRVYIPQNRSNNGAIFFIHGGGFALMDVASYDHVIRELVRKTGMVTVSIDYRLAPQHVFPAGLNDCENALVSFLTKEHKLYNVDPTKVVIMGDSAGGNLATVVALRARNKRNIPALKLQVLIYPVIQFVDLLTPSYQLAGRLTDGTGLVDRESLARWYLVYFGIDPYHMQSLLINNHTIPEIRSSHRFQHLAHHVLPSTFKRDTLYFPPPNAYGNFDLYKKLEPFLFNPDASPIMSNSLAGLPKSLVITCEFDPLRDEGYWYMERMRREGVDTDWIHYDTGFHGMLNFYGTIRLGRQLYSDIASFILKNIDS